MKRRTRYPRRRKVPRKRNTNFLKNLQNSGINGQEAQLLGILVWLGMKYEFVGDGKLQVGTKFPDYISEDGQRIIELFGNRWHKKAEVEPRIEYFQKAGYQDALIIWGNELQTRNRQKLIQKLVEFEDKYNPIWRENR